MKILFDHKILVNQKKIVIKKKIVITLWTGEGAVYDYF